MTKLRFISFAEKINVNDLFNRDDKLNQTAQLADMFDLLNELNNSCKDAIHTLEYCMTKLNVFK